MDTAIFLLIIILLWAKVDELKTDNKRLKELLNKYRQIYK